MWGLVSDVPARRTIQKLDPHVGSRTRLPRKLQAGHGLYLWQASGTSSKIKFKSGLRMLPQSPLLHVERRGVAVGSLGIVLVFISQWGLAHPEEAEQSGETLAHGAKRLEEILAKGLSLSLSLSTHVEGHRQQLARKLEACMLSSACTASGCKMRWLRSHTLIRKT